MCKYWRWILSLAVAAMMTVAVQAADKPVPEEETVELLLLRQKSVQQDLNVGKDTIHAIKEFTNEQHKKAIKANKLNETEREQNFNQLAQENEDFLKKHLTSQQHHRLRQIAMQRAGLLWVTNPSIAKKLELSEKQKQRARDEQMKARGETDEALAARSSREREKKLKELRETSQQRLADLLTAEQQTKWDQMIGVRFDGEITIEEEPSETKN